MYTIFFTINCVEQLTFYFLSKKYQLFENQMVDKGGGKCQLLDTMYSKEKGVHVRQLG